MSETIEHAREGLEHAEHAAAHHTDRTPRRIAVLIAVLAAALALADMGEKGAQNAFLTHHVAVSDDGRSIRRRMHGRRPWRRRPPSSPTCPTPPMRGRRRKSPAPRRPKRGCATNLRATA